MITTGASEDASLITGGTSSSPERVWRLLTECPQISIGLNRQYNTLTLADLWDNTGAALARVCFLLPTVTQDQNKIVLRTAARQSLSSVPSRRLSEAPALQATTPGQVPPPTTHLKQNATREHGFATSIEPIPTVLDEQISLSFSEETAVGFNEEATPTFG